MINSFADKNLESFYGKGTRKAARKFPAELWQKIIDKLFMIEHAQNINDLRVPPSNRLEMLKGDLKGYYSIRVNNQFRLIFQWEDGAAYNVQFIDYH